MGGLRFTFEWTAVEAARHWRHAGVRLARFVLERQAKDLAKKLSSETQLLLAASPYLAGDALIDVLLLWVFRRACFQDGDPPRTRAAFDAAVDKGRESLYPALADVTASALNWFTEARAVRRLLDDPRTRALADLAAESQAHLHRLFDAGSMAALSADGLRQLPRHVKAEERRWQRLLARGSEAPLVLRELTEWSTRLLRLETQLGAELRWIPEIDELRFWIEEYRLSLYAQELKTLGPVSAERLATRATRVEAWLLR